MNKQFNVLLWTFFCFGLFACDEDASQFAIKPTGTLESCEEETLTFDEYPLVNSQSRQRESEFHSDGPNVAALDLDNDGILEIIQCFPTEPVILFTKDSSNYLTLPCGTMVTDDLNQDGWDDLIIEKTEYGRVSQTSWLIVYENVQGELTERYRLFIDDLELNAILTADFNQDGWIDLYLASLQKEHFHSDRNMIAWGKSSWEFDLDTEALTPGVSSRKTFDAIAADFNKDGFVDVFDANDKGNEFGGDVFWWNRDGTLEWDQSCCFPTQAAMGVHAADYNKDGWLDLVTSDSETTFLLEFSPPEDFIDVSLATNANLMEHLEMGWGVIFSDLQNDGQKEILLAQGDQTYAGLESPLFIGDMHFSISSLEDGQFREVNETFGFSQWGSFRSIVQLDWNQDGVLDYWITDVEQAAFLMMSKGCTPNNWISFTGPNHTQVEFKTGNQTWYGEISNASSYAATRSPFWHTGLGSTETVKDVRVRFPNQEWQDHATELDANQNIELKP